MPPSKQKRKGSDNDRDDDKLQTRGKQSVKERSVENIVVAEGSS